MLAIQLFYAIFVLLFVCVLLIANSINSCNAESYAHDIIRNDPLLSNDILSEVEHSVKRLQIRLNEPTKCKFYHFKTLKANLLPVTNVAFNKEGNR